MTSKEYKKQATLKKNIEFRKSADTRFHITSRGDKWEVKKESNVKPTAAFDDKIEAIKFARTFQAKGFDIIIHKANGQVEKRLIKNQ